MLAPLHQRRRRRWHIWVEHVLSVVSGSSRLVRVLAQRAHDGFRLCVVAVSSPCEARSRLHREVRGLQRGLRLGGLAKRREAVRLVEIHAWKN